MGLAIQLTDFRGIAPSIDPTSLPQNMAQQADNVKFGYGGAMRPFKVEGAALVETVDPTLSIFLYKGDVPAGDKWFNRPSDADWVESPVSQDAYGRVYFTGGGEAAPQVTSLTDWDVGCGA